MLTRVTLGVCRLFSLSGICERKPPNLFLNCRVRGHKVLFRKSRNCIATGYPTRRVVGIILCDGVNRKSPNGGRRSRARDQMPHKNFLVVAPIRFSTENAFFTACRGKKNMTSSEKNKIVTLTPKVGENAGGQSGQPELCNTFRPWIRPPFWGS